MCAPDEEPEQQQKHEEKEKEGSNCNQSFFFITDCWNASFLIFACLHSFSFFFCWNNHYHWLMVVLGNHPRQSRPSQSVSLVILMNCGQQTKRKIKKSKNQKIKNQKREKMSTAVFGPIEVGKNEFQNKTLTETNTHQEWEKMFLSIDWLILIDNSKREREWERQSEKKRKDYQKWNLSMVVCGWIEINI